MKRVALVILLVTMVLASTFSNGTKETPAEGPVVLKVGVLAAMTALPVVDAVNEGIDVANGIKIELITFTTGAPMNEAMAAGEIDASCIGAAGVFALANFNAKMISEICDDTIAIDLIARPTSPITAVKGLIPAYPDVYGSAATIKGATVLCPAGTLSQYEVARYLSIFGLTMDDIKFVPMEYGQAYQAFVSNQGDILATRSPQTFTAVDDQGWVSIASLRNLKSSATAQIVVSESAYTKKFDALTTLVRIVHERNDILNGNLDYAAALMLDWFNKCGQKIDIEVSKKQLATKPFYGVGDVKAREFGKDFKETLLEFMISNGQLDASAKNVVSANVKSEVIKAAGLK